MHIGENIRQLRVLHNLSQADLGQIAGVTDKAVSTWELGNKIPRMGALERIAGHFHLTVSDLIEGGTSPLYKDAGLSPEDVVRLKNERDAAVAQLKECCFSRGEDSCRLYCINEGDACAVCHNGDKWKWSNKCEKA